MLPRDPWLIAESLRVLARCPRILDDIRNREAKWVNAFDSETVNIHFARIVEALADKRSVTSVDNLELSRSDYGCDSMDRPQYGPSSEEPSSLSSLISYLWQKSSTP